MAKETIIGVKEYYDKKIQEMSQESIEARRKKHVRDKWFKDYNKLKEEGICTKCKKRKAREGRTMCSECYKYKKKGYNPWNKKVKV